MLLALGADIAFPNMHPKVDAVRMEVLTSAILAATADYAALVRATVVKQGVQAVCIVLTSWANFVTLGVLAMATERVFRLEVAPAALAVASTYQILVVARRESHLQCCSYSLTVPLGRHTAPENCE